MYILVPFYSQKFDYSCGAATLRMVLAYWGINRSETTIARMAGTTKQHGTSPTGLVNAIRSMDLSYKRSAQAQLADISAALRRGRPVLIHYREPGEESSHYALVVGMNDKEIIMHDAYHGKDFILSRAEFRRRWIGYLNYPHRNKGWMVEVWRQPAKAIA